MRYIGASTDQLSERSCSMDFREPPTPGHNFISMWFTFCSQCVPCCSTVSSHEMLLFWDFSHQCILHWLFRLIAPFFTGSSLVLASSSAWGRLFGPFCILGSWYSCIMVHYRSPIHPNWLQVPSGPLVRLYYDRTEFDSTVRQSIQHMKQRKHFVRSEMRQGQLGGLNALSFFPVPLGRYDLEWV